MAYTIFLIKYIEVFDKIAPVKNKKIKRNFREWFDSEISEKLLIRDKFFQKHKRSQLHGGKKIYKTARCNALNFVKMKKKFFRK